MHFLSYDNYHYKVRVNLARTAAKFPLDHPEELVQANEIYRAILAVPEQVVLEGLVSLV